LSPPTCSLLFSTCVTQSQFMLSFLILRRHPRPPLFPYTTLFRSPVAPPDAVRGDLLLGGTLQLLGRHARVVVGRHEGDVAVPARSEEHTSELQSRENLVCRLLLEKKKRKQVINVRMGRCWEAEHG